MSRIDKLISQGIDVILVAITSQIPKKLPTGDYLLPAEDQKQAGLPKPSLVKTGPDF